MESVLKTKPRLVSFRENILIRQRIRQATFEYRKKQNALVFSITREICNCWLVV